MNRLDRSPSFVVVPERVYAYLVFYLHESEISYVERLREVGYSQTVGVDPTRVGDDALDLGLRLLADFRHARKPAPRSGTVAPNGNAINASTLGFRSRTRTSSVCGCDPSSLIDCTPSSLQLGATSN